MRPFVGFVKVTVLKDSLRVKNSCVQGVHSGLTSLTPETCFLSEHP